jgi:hypothetical protein
MSTRFHYLGITGCLHGRAFQNRLCKADLEPKGTKEECATGKEDHGCDEVEWVRQLLTAVSGGANYSVTISQKRCELSCIERDLAAAAADVCGTTFSPNYDAVQRNVDGGS